MANPDHNIRRKLKTGADSDLFKRAVTVCMRAVSGDRELEVRFARTGRAPTHQAGVYCDACRVPG
jgi:cobalamin biosynthesis protein CobT